MGTLEGHVIPGFTLLVIGLWHLFNNIKLYAQNPKTYRSLPWFPSTKIRHLELFLIIIGCSTFVTKELITGPKHHELLDADGTIPTYRIHNFEHSLIFVTFLVYAIFAYILDKFSLKARYELARLLYAIAFGQQLLILHLHSGDHMGVEGQYHMFLQILILTSLVTVLMGIGYQKNFSIGFIWSISMFFQGLWLIVMGLLLWTKRFIPKGCFLNLEKGHYVVRCHGDEALKRAKSLVNIQFCWLLLCVTIFAMSFYLVMRKIYMGKVEYQTLARYDEDQEQQDEDNEAQKKKNKE